MLNLYAIYLRVLVSLVIYGSLIFVFSFIPGFYHLDIHISFGGWFFFIAVICVLSVVYSVISQLAWDYYFHVARSPVALDPVLAQFGRLTGAWVGYGFCFLLTCDIAPSYASYGASSLHVMLVALAIGFAAAVSYTAVEILLRTE